MNEENGTHIPFNNSQDTVSIIRDESVGPIQNTPTETNSRTEWIAEVRPDWSCGMVQLPRQHSQTISFKRSVDTPNVYNEAESFPEGYPRNFPIHKRKLDDHKSIFDRIRDYFRRVGNSTHRFLTRRRRFR